MANEAIIKGTDGLLSVWVAAQSSYLPVACLTEFGVSATRNEITRQTFCNPGVIEKAAGAKERSMSFSGLSLDTTSAGAADLNTKASWDFLQGLFDAGTNQDWRLDAGLTDDTFYFNGFINSLDLSHPSGDEDATFTGGIAVADGAVTTTDPNPVT